MTQVQSLPQKLLKVQRKIGAVAKTATNSHFRSKYMDLNTVLDAVKGPLNEEGIFISQSAGKDPNGQYVETSLIDADTAQQMTGRVYFSGSEDNMQKIGAAITYGRRFGLVSLLSLESEDDDGETAVGRGQPAEPKAAAASKVAPKSAPVATKESSGGSSRKTVLEKISLTSKVIIDSKRATQDEVVALLQGYKVKTKEDLTDEQAKELLNTLERKLNA